MTDDAFNMLKYAFLELPLALWKITKTRAQFLSMFKPVAYNYCISSCCCYTGAFLI